MIVYLLAFVKVLPLDAMLYVRLGIFFVAKKLTTTKKNENVDTLNFTPAERVQYLEIANSHIIC